MGTSQSSNGSPSGTPIVPPWTPDASSTQDSEADTNDDGTTIVDDNPSDDKNDSTDNATRIAPPARFSGARRNIGEYSRSGETSKMKKGLGQYIRKGYGGSNLATRRLASTATTAHSLFSALSTGSSNNYSGEDGALNSASLAGKTAYEVMDIIVETIAPVDGTQDTEASRESIKDALAELLNLYPEANLEDLTEEQREFAIERFVSGDIFRRIDLDLGKSIREKASSTSLALSRLKEIKNYVQETVSSAFRNLKKQGLVMSNNTVIKIANSSIKETCEVFEGYAE